MNDFTLAIIALATIVELGRSAWQTIRVDETEAYCRNLMSICRRLGDKNDALRARVAKLEKGEHV
jgi:hypothetical protein